MAAQRCSEDRDVRVNLQACAFSGIAANTLPPRVQKCDHQNLKPQSKALIEAVVMTEVNRK